MNEGRARLAPPTELTSLVGRELLVDETRQQLERARLVTLAGPGGVGKTRLAMEVARRCRDEGMVVGTAHLADVTTPEGLERAVIGALGIVDQSSKAPIDVLIDHLRDQTALLVLDNCEHLWDAVGDLLAVLLPEIRELRGLATSRRYLEVAGEHVLQVPPLSLPTDGVDQREPEDRSDSTRLLLDRASAAGRVITDDDDWDALVELVHRSGGLPLVLELIAVRLGRGTAPRSILDRLDSGRMLTARGTRRMQPHHKTLQQVLDWSHDLCSEGERWLWARISVFAGGFDLAAAEQVCSDADIAADDVVDLLEGLVQQSLLTSGPDGRYDQLQPLREYGARRLDALGERSRIQEAHCAYYQGLAAEAAQRWFSPAEVHWLSWADRELPNLRAALNYCAVTPGKAETGLTLAVDLARLRTPFFSGLLGEFIHWLGRLLAQVPVEPSPVRIGASALLGWIRLCQGSQADARTQLDHCRDLVGSDGDDSAPVAFLAGTYALLAEHDPIALDLLAKAHAGFGEMGEAYAGDQSLVALILGIAAGFLADEQAGAEASADCLAVAEAQGAEWAISWALWAKALVPLRHGRPLEAIELMQRSLRTQIELGDRWGTTWSAEAIAWGIAALDLPVPAATLLGGTIRLQEATGVAIAGLLPFGRAREEATTRVERLLGKRAYDDAYHRGRQLTADQVYALALLSPDATATHPAATSAVTLDSLSGRQRQIAALIARGLENRQIATELHLSVRTVENHIAGIFARLGVHNRAQVAAWVAEQVNRPAI